MECVRVVKRKPGKESQIRVSEWEQRAISELYHSGAVPCTGDDIRLMLSPEGLVAPSRTALRLEDVSEKALEEFIKKLENFGFVEKNP